MGQGREILLDNRQKLHLPIRRLGLRQEGQRRSWLVRDDQRPRVGCKACQRGRWLSWPVLRTIGGCYGGCCHYNGG